MKCPNCGKDMEGGYLTVPLHANIHSIKWSQTPRHHILDGDILYDPKKDSTWWQPLLTGAVFSAYRCRDCEFVLFNYSHSELIHSSSEQTEPQIDPSWTR